MMEFIRWIIVPVAVALALALFKKLFPAGKRARALSESELAALDRRFLLLRGRVIGGMILIAVLFLVGTWLALSNLNRFFARVDGPSTFLFLPQTAIWWFLPGFGSLSLCWELTLQTLGLFTDRKTADLFSDWTNQSSSFWGHASYVGMDSRKVLLWLTAIVTLPVGIFTALALNMHASVGPETIRDCGYAFKTCSVYRLGDAQRLTEVQGFRTTDGKLTPRAGIVIDFKDGRRWSSANWGNFQRAVDPAFAEFMGTKTALPMNFAPTLEDIPPLAARPAPN
jgi:hypothetical protein